VGALARINNNYEQLRPLAKRACDRLGLKPVCHNPFMNNVAQLVETVHVVEEGIEMIDRLLGRGLRQEEQKVAKNYAQRLMSDGDGGRLSEEEMNRLLADHLLSMQALRDKQSAERNRLQEMLEKKKRERLAAKQGGSSTSNEFVSDVTSQPSTTAESLSSVTEEPGNVSDSSYEDDFEVSCF
jgi:hypothetical protein